MNVKLTKKQTALMTQIGSNGFSFFDDGIVEDSGIWSDALTGEAGPEVSDTAKGAGRVAVSLVKKGLLKSEEAEDGTWFELTAEGAAVANELAGNTEQAPVEKLVLSGEMVEVEVEVDSEPVDTIEELIGSAEDEDPEGEDELVVTVTIDENGAEWTRTVFPDLSYTLKRRQKVSGAWRTDYWGCEGVGEKERFCLSRDVKAAIARGSFQHPLV